MTCNIGLGVLSQWKVIQNSLFEVTAKEAKIPEGGIAKGYWRKIVVK